MELFRAGYNNNNEWHHKCRRFDIGEQGYDIEVGNIFVPSEFDYFFFKHGTPVEHDEHNTDGYAQPEGHHESIAQYPDRVYEGFAAWMCFGFYKIIDCGLAKKIQVPSKGTLIIKSHNHGWSSTDDDPRTSTGVGDAAFSEPEGAAGLDDAQKNMVFYVGVGDDPINDAIYCGGKHIYNKYNSVTGEFHVDAGEITVFVRGSTLWPFKHNNFYFDEFTVEFIPDEELPEPPDPPEPCDCPGEPREQYDRSYLLMHPNADSSWLLAVLESGVWDRKRITIGGSADDAGIGALAYRTALAVRPNDWPGDLREFFEDWYSGTQYIPINVETPEQLKEWLIKWMENEEPDPPNGGIFSPKLPPGIHLNTGDCGLSDWYKRLSAEIDEDDIPPSVKAFGSPDTMATLKLFKDIDVRILTVGRLRNGCDSSINIEGPDLNGDLLAEAHRVMDTSMCAWEPHRAYVDVWEIINEQDPPGTDGHTRLATFMSYCIDIANENGYIVAIMSYPLGVPEWDEMVAVAETGVLAKAKAGGHYLALHEYAKPLNLYYGEAIPGQTANPNRGPLAFRYRFWEDAVCGKENMPNVILTEVNVGQDLRTIPAGEWKKQAKWYMAETSKDEYVKAVHWFGWGSLGDSWEDFDIFLAGLGEDWYQMVLDSYTELPVDPEAPQFNIVPLSQRNPLWSDDKLGCTNYTIGGAGYAMVSSCMKATQVDQSIRPDILNKWLSANDGYTYNGLLVWSKVADFVDGLEFDEYHVWRDQMPADMDIVERCLDDGPCIIQVDAYPGGDLNTHFVVALYMKNDDIRIIDPWTGTECWLLQEYGYEGESLKNSIFALAKYSISTVQQKDTLIGFNDYPGPNGTAADWMIAEGLHGLIVRPIFMSGEGCALDFSREAAAGLRVIVNLRYSYAVDNGGAGTIPFPGTDEWHIFVNAAAYTINNSLGVWGWEMFNEYNNPREWPAYKTLTPVHVVDTYNAIRDLVVPEKRNMAIGSLDPFNAAAGDPRDWLRTIYENISGCEFVAAHGYIRGPHVDLVNSPDKFADAPLQWQFLNYTGCITELLSYLPNEFKCLDKYITEGNHLFMTNEPDWGWVRDGRAYYIVLAMIEAAKAAGFAGLAFYRWSGDQWYLYDNGYALDAVKEILR